MVGYLKPRRVASGEVCSHFVNGGCRVLVIVDLDVHGRFELEVGGNDTRFLSSFLVVCDYDAQ